MTDIEKRITYGNGTFELVLRNQFESLVLYYIRLKYSLAEELSIHRKRYTDPDQFEEMNSYIEWCVNTARKEVYGNE
jgi:hypothetical protein